MAEDTILAVYNNGLFAGALHWSIAESRPITIIVSLSDDSRHADTTQDIRLFLIRALSALLPEYIAIRGSNIKI